MFQREIQKAAAADTVFFQMVRGYFVFDRLEDRHAAKLRGVDYRPTRDWDEVLRAFSETDLWCCQREPTASR